MAFTLIVAPTYMRALTGVYIAGEKQIRGKPWRCEVLLSGGVNLTREGAPVAFDQAGRSAQLFRNEVVTFANEAARIEAAALDRTD